MKIKKYLATGAFLLCGLLGALSRAHAARYTGDQFRDPFTELASSESVHEVILEKPLAPSEFIFGGIIWVPEKPRAIINGRRVFEGAEIDGAKVVEISRKEVTILLNGQEMILKTRTEETS